ncbi:MAG: signal transduction histidine kinase [Saprospiraceae bacterium]|jgi:signal transduction histidine kinase
MLSVVLGYAELLQNKSFKTSEEREEYITQIIAAANRGRSLTKKLLSFSTTHHGENVVIDLNVVVAGLELMLRGLAPNSVSLDLDLTAQICVV